MKLIKPSFQIIPQEDLMKHIELCGRVCYKSEDKINDDSAKRFVDGLIKSGHTSVLEHGTIYLSIPKNNFAIICKYLGNNYSIIHIDKYNHYITTNYRTLIENDWLEDLKYQCEPTEHHEKRVTVKFICDRGVSHEFVRHRVFSFSQESTRYCNYSKDKFGNKLTFIIPNWINCEGEYEFVDRIYDEEKISKEEFLFLAPLENSEISYNELIKLGWTPQQARTVLPNSLKTELVMTGFVEDWKHFFELRTASNAHPSARELAIPLQKEFIKLKYL